MRPLITGSYGQLGRALQELYPDAITADYKDLDITDASAFAKLPWDKIDAIINAAAFTKVDAAEEEAMVLKAWSVNVTGVANLALAARKHDVPFVHISTDYVFDGTATQPYTEDQPVNPQGMYGRTKAASELAATITPNNYVLRTSWVFGDGPNFVQTMLRLGADRDKLDVVRDQKGRPTYAPDLAAAIKGLLDANAAHGLYHATGSGDIVSWAEFAEAIFKDAGVKCEVNPITTAEFAKNMPGMSARPEYSALSLEKLESAGVTMRDWREALKEYLTKERD